MYNSLAIHFFVMNSQALKNKKTVRVTSFVLCSSIIMSTMFIKQHSVFDVVTAFILAFFMYQGVYVRNWVGASDKKERKYTRNRRIPQV